MLQFVFGLLLLILNLLAVSDVSVAQTPPAPAFCDTAKKIKSLPELRDVARNPSGSYCLTADIDASATSGSPFVPIGTSSNPFTGTFDGNGHVIDKLTIGGAGLFASVSSSGIVRNVGITNGAMSISINGGIGGLLVGANGGDVSNCFATGTITNTVSFVPTAGGLIGTNNGRVTNSHASVAIQGDAVGISGFGGFVGLNTGSIIQSYATGEVTGGGNSSGGFAGTNSGTITQSYATGNVTTLASAGGFVGRNTATISQSYSTGSVTGYNGSAGGFAGANFSGSISQSYSTGLVNNGLGFVAFDFQNQGLFTSNYWDVQTSGQSHDGAPNGTKGLTTTQLRAGLPSGFDPSVWGIYPSDIALGLTGTYPYLHWQKAFLVSFPVPVAASVSETFGHCLLNPRCTAHNANIASVMDHFGTPLDPNPTTRLPTWYQENPVPIARRAVTAYTGETGTWTNGRDEPKPTKHEKDSGSGYQNASKTTFVVNGNYVGASVDQTSCGIDQFGNVISNCQCKATKTCAATFLNYDGHSGYDYPFSHFTHIVAPAAGTLYKASKDWVNANSSCAAQGWKQWHTFYIDHGNGFSTWYLHADSLEASIEKTIGNNYNVGVPVTTGQLVAYVGNFAKCSTVGYHLHFEVRQKRGSIVDPLNDPVVDPYADDLWLR
jgi:Peptidase family M23